jgi:peptidoglycan/xylan/chitin deacetylase (PgdA/CDA1 family)
MKHFFRDILIRIIYFSGIAYVYRMLLKPPHVQIVVFHDVPDAAWFTSVLDLFSLHCHVLTPEAFEQKQFHTYKTNILITFDDGYASWVDVCMPVLRAYGYTALFFVNSGLLDVAHDDVQSALYLRNALHLHTPRKVLSWEGARILSQAGHTIGAHGYTHHDLTQLSSKDLEEDITRDRATHLREIGIAPSHFAYPFGQEANRSDSTLALLNGVGYTHVYTATGKYVRHGTPEISRMCIESNQSIHSLVERTM